MENKWGFLRETEQKAQKDGKDKDFGLCRTGLEKYLKVIFPDVNDWVYNSKVPNSTRKFQPDYRSESKKLIVEYDGLPHYVNPDSILNDIEKKQYHESMGYKVVNIPYFIQLSNNAVKELFGVDVKEELFDEKKYPSLGINGRCSPAYLCSAGVERMAQEFKRFPEQYKVNVEYLKEQDPFLSGVKFLEEAYNAKGDKK